MNDDRGDQSPQHQPAPTQIDPAIASTEHVNVPASLLAELNDDPQQIGSYRILQAIGAGGLGTVYKAEQRQPIFRIVAVKLIKLGMDTRDVLARFEQERQTLARLNHPNIAKVFDAGATETGRPYFVMEFVDGQVITTYCDQEKLSTRQRLELFVDVCHALEHAHSRGIVHRDLKPSNVMVCLQDDHPTAKVIDFGIAKAIDNRDTSASAGHTLYTAYGQILGTPEYMSPEQAEVGGLAIDPRADVFSLGVMLYELLTGALPFEPGTLRRPQLAEVQRIIREVDPPPPSTRLGRLGDAAIVVATRRRTKLDSLRRELKRELEWIPLKAMRKDRSERYRSAADMADDIDNYLNGRPLLAGPVSHAYRIKKFVRRHRLGIAVTVLFLIGTLVAASLVGASIARERGHRQLAQVMLNRAREDDRYLMQAAEELRHRSGTQLLRKRLLERSRQNYHEYIKLGLDDPAMRADLVEAYFRLGYLASETGSRQESGDAYRAALKLADELLAEKADHRGLQGRKIDTLINLAAILDQMGNVDAAQAAYQQALDLATKLSAAQHDDVGTLDRLSQAQHSLASFRASHGEHDAARALYDAALKGRQRLLDLQPNKPAAASVLAATYINLGELNHRSGQRDASIGHFKQARELLMDAVSRDPGSVESQRTLAAVESNLAALAWEMEQYDRARQQYQRALELLTDLARANPTDNQCQADLARAHSSLADFLMAVLDQPREALPHYEQSAQLWKTLVVLDPAAVDSRIAFAKVLTLLANAQLRLGDRAAASQRLGQASDEWAQVLTAIGAADDPANRALRVEGHNSLAWILLLRGSPIRAEGEARKGLAIQPDSVDLKLNLAHARLFGEAYQEAQQLYSQIAAEHPELIAVIHSDFADLRGAGQEHLDTAKIAAQFPLPASPSTQPTTGRVGQ